MLRQYKSMINDFSVKYNFDDERYVKQWCESNAPKMWQIQSSKKHACYARFKTSDFAERFSTWYDDFSRPVESTLSVPQRLAQECVDELSMMPAEMCRDHAIGVIKRKFGIEK